MAGITWLHLSDWHQRGKNLTQPWKGFDKYVVGDMLINDIRNRANIHADITKIDFIIFSGDVAFSGQTEEYEAAIESLFKPVLEVTELTSDRLFIVPGNHDFDREKLQFLTENMKRPFESNEQINEWLTEDKNRAELLSPFSAYQQFVSKYTGQDQPAYANTRRSTLAGKQIALLGLNSAFLCGRHKDEKEEVDDLGFLAMGEPQLHDSLKQIADADVRIAVLHHPFDWFAEADRDLIENRLKRACHFILCGHLHKPKVVFEQGTGGDCVTIPAGASFDKRIADNPRYTNAYNFMHLDFDTAQGTIYLRRWSEVNTEWIPDTESHPHLGFFQFHLPKQEPKPQPNPVVPPQNVQINSADLQKVDPVKLREAMVIAYNLADLQILCANLYISYDDISGEAREVKILHLIEYFQRRGWYNKLVSKVLQERPHLFNELTR
jgi:predicted phosphodiesterase